MPSENLSRPLYLSAFGYNGYADATTVRLDETDADILTFSSSDYRTNFKMATEFKFGWANATKLSVGVGFSVQAAEGKLKLGIKSKDDVTLAHQRDKTFVSSWTKTLSDTLGLRGAWEAPTDYLNPDVGRRYQPTNIGYALVESITADVYVSRLRSTGVMVGKVIVPNTEVEPDKNIITFRIDPSYTKAGTLDGKVGMANDLAYPKADLARGSYFKPAEAYRLAAKIAKADEQAMARFDQFNSEEEGRSPGGASGIPGSTFYDFGDGRASRGIVNRYVWTAAGGLHVESEQFTATRTRTYSGFFTLNGLIGPMGDAEIATPYAGAYGAIDALLGGEIKVQVGKSKSETHGFAVTVTNTCDPTLQGYDEAATTYTTSPVPGKVDAYRFMTFYLPPDADNGDTLLERVVDQNWLKFSSDPNAIAMRGLRIKGRRAWRVLHRVTYVSRVPPAFDTNPSQTVAHRPLLDITVEDNPRLADLVQGVLGKPNPTLAEIGAAVASVLAPTDESTPKLGSLVGWWTTFLNSTRTTDPDPRAVALRDQIVLDTVEYMQAGYATGVLPRPTSDDETGAVPLPRQETTFPGVDRPVEPVGQHRT